ncbi:MAG: hypothetical protein M5U34_22805 [Chloroflexi bacterium]|nr:hypothetical protein [Chloroflexota bacterium]
METAVTDGLSFRADKRMLETTFSEITQPKAGLLGQLESRARGGAGPRYLRLHQRLHQHHARRSAGRRFRLG